MRPPKGNIHTVISFFRITTGANILETSHLQLKYIAYTDTYLRDRFLKIYLLKRKAAVQNAALGSLLKPNKLTGTLISYFQNAETGFTFKTSS